MLSLGIRDQDPNVLQKNVLQELDIGPVIPATLQ